MGTTTGFQAIETDGNFYVSGNLSSGQALTTTGGFLSTDSIPTSLVPPVGSISLGSNNGGVGNPAFINLSRRGAFNAASFGTDLAGDFIFYRNPSSTISFDGTEVYKIVRSTGNFLLGTNVDSGYKLDVTDSTGKVVGINQTGVTNSPAMTIDYSGAGGGNLFSQSIFRVTSNSTNRNFASFGDVAVIDSSGRLFLNTPASGNFLDVGGSARVLNDLTVTDGITSLSNSGASNLLNLTFNGGTNAAAINISQTNAGGIGGYPFSLFRMDNRGSNDSVYIHNNGTNPFVIRNTGNVGIGTSTPAYKLDVNGNARISGGITTSEYMSTLANESISIGGIGGGLLTPGSQNVGIGGVTGPSSGTSNDNFFGGYRAGFYNGSGNHVGNVVIGSVAAYIQNGTLTNNVIIGRQSAGQGNLAADYVNTIILGAYASKQTTGGTLNNTTIIGTSLTTDLDNIVALGRSDQNILIGQTTTDLGYKLQVGSSSVSGIVASFTNSSGSCTINPTAGIACSSDQRLKKNIAVLEDNYLSKIMSLKPVKYNWNNETDTDGLHNGFIAQDLEQVFPDLVATDSNGMKSVFYTNLIPYTIKAIQEMNIQMIGLSNLEKPNGLRDSLIGWLGNAGNHITRIFTGEICLTDSSGSSECINKTELRQLKQLLQNPTPPVSNPDPEIVPPPTE
jgi:hypothetical protein